MELLIWQDRSVKGALCAQIVLDRLFAMEDGAFRHENQ